MKMHTPQFEKITPMETTSYEKLVTGLATASWPEFMLHDPVADRLWDDLFMRFPEYQFALVDTETGRTAAMANSLGLAWDGDPQELPETGWDWAFQKSVEDHAQGLRIKTQCAIQIAIHPDYRGMGLSSRIVQIMREIGQKKGFTRLIAPVRPNQKSLYPLISMADYITWQTGQGLPFDAWLRVHVRAGARIVKACQQAMDIRGTRAEWQAWTGLQFPQSGEYVIPGGLVPMKMDVESDLGIYIEPNVWVVHELGNQPSTAK